MDRGIRDHLSLRHQSYDVSRCKIVSSSILLLSFIFLSLFYIVLNSEVMHGVMSLDM